MFRPRSCSPEATTSFPVEFLRTLAKDRLNIAADEMDGDHCSMLGHPTELAERLEAYRLDVVKR